MCRDLALLSRLEVTINLEILESDEGNSSRTNSTVDMTKADWYSNQQSTQTTMATLHRVKQRVNYWTFASCNQTWVRIPTRILRGFSTPAPGKFFISLLQTTKPVVNKI
nr:uncharacterized protein LOC112282740 [Physcomitrium patens]|eukprot:XP_024376535.1 uncharacterized protein LOC112282740 [Physcomitrella patens]